ncbi:alkyldihydroxyacetonephosphate synthase, peroxisomal-like, partial [Diaphorina citri]|uniref:Alkylglycerone-phosphate synthase n=1 Tax=Diaphorina citri TaxID=121845 RepID=A0A1S4EQD1_DIACI
MVKRCQPSSIRLVDNVQLKAGQFFRPDPGYLELLTDGLKKLYVTKILGFRDDEMCAATVLFEGDPEDVKNNEDKIYSIAKRYGGIPAGESNGRRGYMLTYIIAYIRDFACDYYFIGDSFETSVPWDKTVLLCINVKKRLTRECTACDWVYHDFSCSKDDSCLLSSPGYPGLYPAHASCSYLITSSSQITSVHIKFLSMSFPVNHCGTDYVTIHEGSSPSSPLLDTICSNQKQDFVYTSPKILIVF